MPPPVLHPFVVLCLETSSLKDQHHQLCFWTTEVRKVRELQFVCTVQSCLREAGLQSPLKHAAQPATSLGRRLKPARTNELRAEAKPTSNQARDTLCLAWNTDFINVVLSLPTSTPLCLSITPKGTRRLGEKKKMKWGNKQNTNIFLLSIHSSHIKPMENKEKKSGLPAKQPWEYIALKSKIK